MDRIKIIKIFERILLLLAVVAVVVATVWSPPSKAAETDEAKELGFWVEAQVLSRKQPSRAILWYEKDVTDSFGFFAFAWKESDGYREFVAGPTWKPFEGLQVGAGIGREVVPEEGRGMVRMFFFDATRGNFNLYGAFENGRVSGPWEKITATYAVTERFGLGIMHESGLGNGPRFEWNIRKDFQVWGAFLRGRVTGTDDISEKKATTVFGVNFSF